MERIAVEPRSDWLATAADLGFRHSGGGAEAEYWDETGAFAFSLAEIEDEIESVSEDLHERCLALVERAVDDQAMLARLGVPEHAFDLVRTSWRDGEPTLYGRFDLAYDGKGPAKLLEYNADTPTCLYEAAVFQWVWLEQMRERGAIPAGSDQFNSIHERLIDVFRDLDPSVPMHFVAERAALEDAATAEYLADCAQQAGLTVLLTDMTDVGMDGLGRFCDEGDRVIDRMFKLHPWEFVFGSPYGSSIARSGCSFFEPPWKSILSSKAILPVLWEMFPGHPNLLPSHFEGSAEADRLDRYVRKPIHSREGANVRVVRGSETIVETTGIYDGPAVVQEIAPVFQSDRGTAILGS